MPPKNLPDKAKEIYSAAEKSALSGTCKDSSDKKACASKVAWSAVKSKFKKDDNGNWIPKSNFRELSFEIVKASFQKSEPDPNKRMRFRMVASDTEEDLRGDNMTSDLYDAFVSRIKSGEPPMDSRITENWPGGMPYLSVAHFLDYDGKGIPGDIENVYRDGNCLKAVGTFKDTELGKACFDSILDDLYNQEKSDHENKIRVSIAFLDYKHKHKSNGVVFERSEPDDICLNCLVEMLTKDYSGVEFLDGHLVHLALTRVPVNPRTPVELELEEKSMSEKIKTKQDDAASIVGENLAEMLANLDDDEVEELKSMVIKSDSDDVSDIDEPTIDEVISEPESEPEIDDEVDMSEKILEALSTLTDKISELSDVVTKEPEPAEEVVVTQEAHVIDEAVEALKSAFDEQERSNATPEEKLQAIQGPFAELGELLKSYMGFGEEPEPTKEVSNVSDEIEKAVAPLAKSIELLSQQLASQQESAEIPGRRNIKASQYNSVAVDPNKPVSIESFAKRSVGLG